MARSIDHDPFHQFRFAPQIGFDGRIIGMSRVAIRPGKPWTGEGEVILEAQLKPEMIDFAKLRGSIELVVGLYKKTDSFGVDGEPSGTIYLKGVVPLNAKMELTELNACEGGVISVTLTMKYDRLTFLFGNCPLEKMAAAVS